MLKRIIDFFKRILGIKDKPKETVEYETVNVFVPAIDTRIEGVEIKTPAGEVPVQKPKRTRTSKGKYKADDKSTKDVNEAWLGGKSPAKPKKTTKKDP